MSAPAAIGHGRSVDWGRTSADYALYRPGPPPSFYDRLAAFGVGLPGQRILGAALSEGEISAFDAEHDALLQRDVGERFTVLHRLDAHLLEFK